MGSLGGYVGGRRSLLNPPQSQPALTLGTIQSQPTDRPESTTVDIKTGLGVNRRTARCQPPLTQNPRRTPEVYKPPSTFQSGVFLF